MRQSALVLVLALAACRNDPRPALAIGATIPDFALPGADGQTHKLADYAATPVLAVVFTCNHCATAQLYKKRIQKLSDDYRGQVAVVAISPNTPDAVAIADRGYSDTGDSLKEMTTRAEYRHLTYPYLYDGDAQTVSKAFGVLATPQIFVFDQDRKLRYEGRIDDNVNESSATSHDARDAMDALLSGRNIKTAHTQAKGCPPAWGTGVSKPLTGEDPPMADAASISIEMANADALKKLRTNGTDKLLLVNFWATWCGPCAVEFPDLVETSRMYRPRGLEFVSVSENQPEERPNVLEFLRRKQASSIRHLLFSSPDTYVLQAAFDPAMPAAVPFTLLIASNGDVMYQEIGTLDIMKMRRAILANLPDDRDHAGVQAYWSN